MPVSLPKPNFFASSTSGSLALTLAGRSRTSARSAADAVEERVAGDLSAFEVDHAVALGLVVLEGTVADLDRGRAVELGVGGEAVGQRTDRHDRLPGRAGRELALHRARQQRVPAFSE
jgi:hypothetical protein